jgi:hypothetical protein
MIRQASVLKNTKRSFAVKEQATTQLQCKLHATHDDSTVHCSAVWCQKRAKCCTTEQRRPQPTTYMSRSTNRSFRCGASGSYSGSESI